MKAKLLIVDDDEAIGTQMKWALSQDYDVCFAEDRRGALEAYEANSPVATLLDLGLPPRPNECDEGMTALSDILAIDRSAKVIVVSGQSEKQNAIQAVGAGAYDFLCKPVEMDTLKLLLRRCIHVVDLEKEYRQLQQSQRSEVFEDMLGTSPQMQSVFSFIRKVAATNADLKQLVESGKFREDLYFRIAVVTLRLLPLRERGEDVVFLAREFLQRYGAQSGRGNVVFAPDALRAMTHYSWPGNVRELQNRVKRGVIMADGSRVAAKDLELDERDGVSGSSARTLKQAREQVERDMIQQALKRHSGKITAAAADLGISRPTLYELMDKLGIAKERADAGH